jgi:hypothetical protein
MRVSKLTLPLLGLLSGLLAGCSANFGASDTGPVKASATIQGKAFGGQQPVSNAHVYLYEVGTGGYGGASVSLLNSSAGHQDANGNYYVLTDTGGNFSVSGDYTCTGGSTGEVYVYVSGGDPQLTGIGVPSGNNPYIGLMAVLGTCANITPGYYVTVNEASTVATAYALAGFATDATHIGSSGTALAKQGVVNAGMLALNMVDQGTGTANATFPNNSTAIVPVNTINAFADILSYCVNSTGSGNCSSLFSKTLSASGTQPVDTATAAIYMAQNPSANGNVSALIGLIPATAAPFATTLSSANDLTIGVGYYASGFGYPEGIAIDGSGNAWVLGLQPQDTGSSAIVGISPSGVLLNGSSGFTVPNLGFPAPYQQTNNNGYVPTIDTAGNIWSASINNDVVVKVSPSGTITYYGTLNTATSYLNEPAAVAVDASGDVWVANYGGNNVNQPNGVLIDGSGNIWTSNGGTSFSKITSAGVAVTGANGFSGNGIGSVTLFGSAIDSKGNVWFTTGAGDFGPTCVGEISNTGSVLSGSGGYCGLDYLNGFFSYIALDGLGNAWVVDSSFNPNSQDSAGVAEFASTGTPLSNGEYTAGGNFFFYDIPGVPAAVAVDGSGNVWGVNRSGVAPVVEMVGAAAPVITPICAGLPATPTADGSSKLGTRP